MKLWAGRFQKQTDEKVNDFNSSLAFDSRMFKEDIQGSMAHAAMLGACGIIPEQDSEAIVRELKHILDELCAGTLAFDPAAEDIHMFVEQVLTERLGETGKRLHTARSRNDQVALDLRMYLKTEVRAVQKLILRLQKGLLHMAGEHTGTVMPGYTHLQRAQPVTFAHHLLAYAEMLKRDYGRLDDCYARMDEMPLGSGALATTTYPIDRAAVAQALGFRTITANSMDSVADRDFVIELVGDLSILMMHLSRFSEEIILWSSGEFGFITLDDAYSTGSSIMPQKKNPDVAELVRGKTGRVYGSLVAVLAMMKSLPLAYNKDMQEDKQAVFDAVDTVKMCLDVFTPMFETVTVNTGRMRAAAAGGFINATDCADYLVRKGLAFRDAYKIVGTLIAYCIAHDTDLERLPLETYREFCPKFGEDIYAAVDVAACAALRSGPGGPGPASVRRQLESLRAFIEEREAEA